LYAITDKSSSAIGPALTGLIISLTGNIRLAFMLVCIMFVCAILVLRHLNLIKGKLDAEEVGPVTTALLEEPILEEEEVAGVGAVPEELRGKEDNDQ
jgi:Vacuole effluxer Atg22 like